MKINELLTGGKTGSGLYQGTHGRLLKYQSPVINGALAVLGRSGTLTTSGRTETLSAHGRAPTMEVVE